jgi:hypothetical protein
VTMQPRHPLARRGQQHRGQQPSSVASAGRRLAATPWEMAVSARGQCSPVAVGGAWLWPGPPIAYFSHHTSGLCQLNGVQACCSAACGTISESTRSGDTRKSYKSWGLSGGFLRFPIKITKRLHRNFQVINWFLRPSGPLLLRIKFARYCFTSGDTV